jgi:hypothetical protein
MDMLRQRWGFTRTVFSRRNRIIAVPFVGVLLYEWFAPQLWPLLPNDFKGSQDDAPVLGDFLGAWSPWGWLILLLAFLLVAGFEGAFRHSQKLEGQLDEARQLESEVTGESESEIIARLQSQAVTLNGYQITYADALQGCAGKLAKGATEHVIEWRLDLAFPRPEVEGDDDSYFKADPGLDDFLLTLQILDLVAMEVRRIMPGQGIISGIYTGGITPFGLSSPPPPDQRVISVEDIPHYKLTALGLRVVKELPNPPVRGMSAGQQ